MRMKDAVGRHGEDLAARHLESAGLTILARNWRCRAGELDIVARDGSVLVFAEVKTRSSLAYGSGAAAISREKSARIRQLAVHWMSAYREHDGHAFWAAVRFDVVSIVGGGAGFEVTHIVGAF